MATYSAPFAFGYLPELFNRLAAFPVCAAFPRSEYYAASDAHALHRWTAQLPAWASHVHADGLYERL
jgi:hypothetical protein